MNLFFKKNIQKKYRKKNRSKIYLFDYQYNEKNENKKTLYNANHSNIHEKIDQTIKAVFLNPIYL